MVRAFAIVLLVLSSTNAFFNIRRFIPSSSFVRNIPLRKTPMMMNYLQQIENNSSNRTVLILNPKPRYARSPIPLLTFDELFVKISSINHILMSANADRIIVYYGDKCGVFYMSTQKQKLDVEYLISLIDVDITIVNDYPTKMDSPSGEYYCTPKHVLPYNITMIDVENIMNGILDDYRDNENDGDEDDDEDDDEDNENIDEDDGGFGNEYF